MTMPTVRLTVAQALVRFLARQYTERDGAPQRGGLGQGPGHEPGPFGK
jgi:TPP-dependent trihydroxycyclohexane-1,2-dione (THcHDO) dehydratase